MVSWSFFKSALRFSRVPLHCTTKCGIPLFLALRCPKVHFGPPNATWWVPCSKPFINTRFWDVFWGPRTGKCNFPHKSTEYRQNPNFHQKAVFGVKSAFPARMRKTSQNVTFSALKTCSFTKCHQHQGFRTPKTQNSSIFSRFHQITGFTKIYQNSATFGVLGPKVRSGPKWLPNTYENDNGILGILASRPERALFHKNLRNSRKSLKFAKIMEFQEIPRIS